MRCGLYLHISDQSDRAANRLLQAWCQRLLSELLPGVSDLIPSYGRLYIEYDDSRVSLAQLRRWCHQHYQALAGAQSHSHTRRVDIPVCYDGEDLAEIAAARRCSVQEVAAVHSSVPYHVYALGFAAGFPFMGDVPEAIRYPRRPSPRVQVPAHSLAMTHGQTGIYPMASPGGWNLLGRALVAMYDPQRQPAFALEPGDEVCFIPQDPACAAPLGEVTALELLPADPAYPCLEVLKAGLLDVVVDGGRFLGGRYGLSRSGALDQRAAQLANALLANPHDAPLIEINLRGGHFAVLRPLVLAFAGQGMQPLRNGEKLEPNSSYRLEPGDELHFQSLQQGCRGYLAIAGGVASKRFWNSASVDLKAKLGRPLRPGDILGQAQPAPRRAGRHFRPHRFTPYGQSVRTLRLLAGPQASPEAWQALTSQTFQVGFADRMGLRLQGGSVPGGELLSEATPLGAVQIPPSGEPIILLHDRGTLGGYHKPAVVHPEDLSYVSQLRLGQALRFVQVQEPTPAYTVIPYDSLATP